MTPGTLYLVPSPLGEGDVSGVLPDKVLQLVSRLDTFIVEQPKTARQFLKRAGHPMPLQALKMLVLDEHTRPDAIPALLEPLLSGKDAGLLSEAGCPSVADPGAQLVRLAHEKKIRVVPLVGPSSILLALMASGLNGQRFAFHGYLPVEQSRRAGKLVELERESRQRDQTQIFIEAPYRNMKLLESVIQACHDSTLLCIATDVTLATESIVTRTVGGWKREPPDIARKPTVFLLYSEN